MHPMLALSISKSKKEVKEKGEKNYKK